MRRSESKRNQRHSGLRAVVVICPLLFVECSLVLNDLPEPRGDAAGNGGQIATGARGGVSNQAGHAQNGGQAGAGTSATDGGSAHSTGGVGAGGSPALIGGEGGAPPNGGGAANGGNGAGGCDPCDCDGDGALNDGCHSGGGPADCDDTDPDAKPGQTKYFTEANPVVGFDYNCANGIEREYDDPLSCPALLADCMEDVQGYIDTVPECGEPGTWGHCDNNGIGCVKEAITSVPLGCR